MQKPLNIWLSTTKYETNDELIYAVTRVCEAGILSNFIQIRTPFDLNRKAGIFVIPTRR